MIETRELKVEDVAERVVTFEYESDRYYHVMVERTLTGWDIFLSLHEFDKPCIKKDEEKLVEDYKTDLRIFAAFTKGEEVGLVLMGQLWEGSYRIWDLYVWPKHKRQGVGRTLMAKVEEVARAETSRRIILETQSSNYPAISFYLSCGFQLCGFDTACYTNEDIKRKEVRLEFHKLLR